MPERLTDRKIAALKPSSDGSVYHFDSEVSGLAVRVYPSGLRAFVFDWREHGRQRRVTIGRHPAWTVGKARTHAGKMRLKADVGEPVAAGRGGRVVDLIEDWRAVLKVTRRPNTVRSYSRLIDAHIVPAFGRHDPRALTRNMIEHWHGTLAQKIPVDANRSLAVLSSFLSWLAHDGKVAANMARGVKRVVEAPRQIFLAADEIVAAHVALDRDADRPAALAIRLSLLTGARIGEAVNLKGEQIDTGRRLWVKQALTVKQKRQHIVPLQDEALAVAHELLRVGPPDYDRCRRVWLRVRRIIGRDDTHIHDLRHSRASALARNGASLLAIGKILGHSSPAMTARYAHLVSDDLRELVERA